MKEEDKKKVLKMNTVLSGLVALILLTQQTGIRPWRRISVDLKKAVYSRENC